MGMTAGITKDPCDYKGNHLVIKLHTSFIGTMPNETSGMTAGTLDQGEIQRRNDVVIKILCKMVEIFCTNCYHNQRHGGDKALCWG